MRTRILPLWLLSFCFLFLLYAKTSAQSGCTNPVVTLHPTNATACHGDHVSFTVAATGTPTPTVLWQYYTGQEWHDLPFATSTTLTYYVDYFGFTPHKVRAKFTNECKTVYTNSASLTIHTRPRIECEKNVLWQTNDKDKCGASVNLSSNIEAGGYPTPTKSYKIGETVITSPHFFPVGMTEVTAYATNSCGTVSCTFDVIVADRQPPTPRCKNATLYLDANGEVKVTPDNIDNGSFDNCGEFSRYVQPYKFDCDDIGSNIVRLFTYDGNSHFETSCEAKITIKDTINPVVKCKTATAYLDENGNATITPADVDDGSGDNCDYSLDVSPSTFNCNDLGDNSVTLTITDDADNKKQCVTTVTVVDNIPPTAACKNISIYLDMNGYASITPDDIDNGSSDNCGITSKNASKTEFGCDDEGANDVILTVTDASSNSDNCTAVVTVKKRPTVLTYTGDLVEQYSDEVSLSATLIDELTGTPLSGKTITFEIGTQSTTGVTDATGVATATLILTQDPCDKENWTVKATFAGDCPYRSSEDEDAFDYLPEDAEDIEYTGTAISATENMNSDDFTVTLVGIVIDKNDGYPGDVSNAQARFMVNGTPVSEFIPVLLLNSGDPSIGMIEFDWSDELAANPTTYDVQVELLGCYYNGTSAKYPLTIYKAAGDFITGGGHMFMTSDAEGVYEPDLNSKLNFGFNVKFNKKGTNLQGKMNIIFRRTEAGSLHTYQIKTNATTSLGTNLINPDEMIAEFMSKANLTDVTNPAFPVEIAGNLTLHVRMTDKGEPGNMDKIAFTLYDGSPDALWFSSRWNETHSEEQVIANGNLLVHSGAFLGAGVEEPTDKKNKSAQISTELSGFVEGSELVVYPNPFSNSLKFEFVSPLSTHALLEIYDITGRKVKTIFNKNVKSEVNYNAEFSPGSEVSNLYFYRMKLGSEIFYGKVVYKK